MPVYDEAAAIERVVAEWLPALAAADPGFVLLVVDDGSRDGTAGILARLAAAEPRMRVHRQENAGHGAACRRGYEIATGEGSDAGWILQIDSDGQCDPADLASFWRRRADHPVQLGRRRREDGWLRAATSRLLALLVSAFAVRRVRDPNVPFRLMRRDLLAGALARLADARVELFNAALSVACAELGPVAWGEVRFRPRLAGRSHYRPGRMGRLAADLLGWLLRDRPGRALAVVAWCALALALALYGARNLGDAAIWYDEAVQVHTSIGLDPLAPPGSPPGSWRAVVARNGMDQLDPGGFGVLLHAWMGVAGTAVPTLRLLPGLLALAGLAALAALAGRWMRHPLAPPAAVALALLDPLVREHAVEVRPYALELAALWIAFWAADRLVARPGTGRGLALGAALVALVGARYSGFLAGGALAGALAVELVPPRPRPGQRRRPLALAAALLPAAAALAVIARWSLPGLVRRSSYHGGELVGYLRPHTAEGLSLGQAAVAALQNLAHPAVLALSVAAALAPWGGARTERVAGDGGASLLVRRTALLLLVLTAAVWPWHPWDPSTKWSLYLRLVSTVCLVRLVADALPGALRHRVARRVAAAAAVALVAAGAWTTAGHRRGRWDVALPALERLAVLLPDGVPGRVAVDAHPMPAVRYHYELGSLRGRPEYPGAFLLPVGGAVVTPEAMCGAGWLLSFDGDERLAQRYPGFGFARDPVAGPLLRVTPAGTCG